MKKMSKKVKIGGKVVEVTSVSGLAEIVGRSRATILRWEKDEVFPPAPIILGTYKYYPISYCSEVAKIVKDFQPNKAPRPELITRLNKLYKEEIEKYA